MKLDVVVLFHNQLSLLKQALKLLDSNSVLSPNLILINNASTENTSELQLNYFTKSTKFGSIQYIPNEKNIGVFPVFAQSLKVTNGDIIAFPHSDLLIWEDGWDKRVVEAFEQDDKLAIVGVLGSFEIDNWGGRGLGTMSNFQGRDRGSAAEIHGKRTEGLVPSAAVDGCFMAFRRSFLEEVKDLQFPPHHFYDRLLCCEALQRGYRVATLGLACDHISGQTANCEEGWKRFACEWAGRELHISHYNEWAIKNRQWMLANSDLHQKAESNGWDEVIYLEAEMRFLKKWRDKTHFIPLQVKPDYGIYHISQLYNGG